MAKTTQSLDSLCKQALENAVKDRAKTEDLLDGITNLLKSQDKNDHALLGPTVSKYLEALARSNQQVVAVAQIVARKDDPEEDANLSAEELKNLMDEVKKEQKEQSGKKK